MGASASVWMWRAQVSTSSRVRTMNGRFLTPVADCAGRQALMRNPRKNGLLAVPHCHCKQPHAPACTWLLQDALQRLQGVLEHVVRADVHLKATWVAMPSITRRICFTTFAQNYMIKV